MSSMRAALQHAYAAGFKASGEGYNAEYPFNDDFESNKSWMDSRDENVRRILAQTAALTSEPEPARVKVRALEWEEIREPKADIRYTHVVAESPIGQWSIEWKSWKDYDDKTIFLDGHFVGDGGYDLESAQAAAQADYERRILSAIEPTAPAADVVERPEVTDEMVDVAFRAFSDKMLMREEDRSLITSVLKAALALAPALTGWRSMDSAPKDGTRILVATVWEGDETHPNPFQCVQVAFWDKGHCLHNPDSVFHRPAEWIVERIGNPIAWMPLPAPAKEG